MFSLGGNNPARAAGLLSPGDTYEDVCGAGVFGRPPGWWGGESGPMFRFPMRWIRAGTAQLAKKQAGEIPEDEPQGQYPRYGENVGQRFGEGA